MGVGNVRNGTNKNYVGNLDLDFFLWYTKVK